MVANLLPNVVAMPIDLSAYLERQRAAFLREEPPTLEHRRDALAKLKRAVLSHRQHLVAATSTDFGFRSAQETSLLELAPVISGIDYLYRELPRLMRPQRRRIALQFLPGSTRVVYQPLGVVGIISAPLSDAR
jgi:coniferyl-aldehyde dehydrogenase